MSKRPKTPGLKNRLFMSSTGLLQKLKNCHCCPRGCGVNRLAGEKGICRIGENALVASTGLHFGEEPPISGHRGSGTLFFAGCNLTCVFCQNWDISQRFHHGVLHSWTPDRTAEEMLRLQDRGAHNINLVSPSHVAWQIAEAIVIARQGGLSIPIVYNSNGYDALETLESLEGLIEIYMPDLKYMDDDLAMRYSGVDNYSSVAAAAIKDMLRQVGHLQMDGEGVAVRGLLVRHLVLPGHAESSRRCLAFLASLSKEIHINLMSQYHPQFKARSYPPIHVPLSASEYREIAQYARELGLFNLTLQGLANIKR